MPKIKYVDREFSKGSLALIEMANGIIGEYVAQGYELTLRQLYYQFVARGSLANTVKSYKRLGSVVNDARLAGLIDWNSIEDRTRGVEGLSHWETPGEIIESATASYHLDWWETQPCRVEVWVEKEALAGVFTRTCKSLDIPILSCRGYTSQSEMWRAAVRLMRWEQQGQKVVILHFGDHDPSGIDMSRDIADRLALFGAEIDFRRLALNMDQVEQYTPPPNPAKTTDSRFADYVQRFGDESWELDALDPSVLDGLVREAVEGLIDEEEMYAVKTREDNGRDLLEKCAKRWDDVVELLS